MTTSDAAIDVSTTTAVDAPVQRVRNLVKEFPIRAGVFRRQVGSVKALSDVTLDVYQNETLGVVNFSVGYAF